MPRRSWDSRTWASSLGHSWGVGATWFPLIMWNLAGGQLVSIIRSNICLISSPCVPSTHADRSLLPGCICHEFHKQMCYVYSCSVFAYVCFPPSWSQWVVCARGLASCCITSCGVTIILGSSCRGDIMVLKCTYLGLPFRLWTPVATATYTEASLNLSPLCLFGLL